MSVLCLSAVFVGVNFLKAPSKTYAATFSGGSGTIGDPYKIASVGDLVAIANEITSKVHFEYEYFKQIADINITTTWTSSIGSSTTSYFGGIYDGNGYSINWNSGTYSSGNSGIFGYIRNATISNVKVNANEIKLGGTSTYNGIVAKRAQDSAISGCIVTVKVYETKSASESNNYTGAILGWGSTTIVERCFARGNSSNSSNMLVKATVGTGGSLYFGSVVGRLEKNSKAFYSDSRLVYLDVGGSSSYFYNGGVRYKTSDSANSSMWPVGNEYDTLYYVISVAYPCAIAAPNSGEGYTIGNMPTKIFIIGGYESYTFTLTLGSDYSNSSPTITLFGSALPYTKSGLVYTFTATTSYSHIYPSSFTVSGIIKTVNVTLTYNANTSGKTPVPTGYALPSARSVTPGAALGTLPTMNSNEYDFGGWYTNTACTTAFSASTIMVSTTIYAKWTLKSVITLHKNTTDTTTPNDTTQAIYVTKGQAYNTACKSGTGTTLTKVTNLDSYYSRPGYAFLGWFTSAADTNGVVGTKVNTSGIVSTDTVNLYARWVAATPIVTFDKNYIPNPSAVTLYPSSKAVVYGKTYGSLPTPTLDGFKFGGWFTSAAYANALTGDTGRVTNSTKVTIQGDHKLYARWITV